MFESFFINQALQKSTSFIGDEFLKKYQHHTILITAPEKVRIQRVMKRDQLTIPEIKTRIKNQWSDDEKILLADTIIENIQLEKTKDSVRKIHLYLLDIIKNDEI